MKVCKNVSWGSETKGMDHKIRKSLIEPDPFGLSRLGAPFAVTQRRSCAARPSRLVVEQERERGISSVSGWGASRGLTVPIGYRHLRGNEVVVVPHSSHCFLASAWSARVPAENAFLCVPCREPSQPTHGLQQCLCQHTRTTPSSSLLFVPGYRRRSR